MAEHGPIGTAVLAFGILGDQARAESDVGHAVAVVHTDYVAQVSLLSVLAATMRAARTGNIVVFSSIAGVRARRANYVYGSGQAGWTGSPAAWPMHCMARAFGCSSCVPGSSSVR